MRTHITWNICVHMPAGVSLYVFFSACVFACTATAGWVSLDSSNRKQETRTWRTTQASSKVKRSHTCTHKKKKKKPKQNTHIFFFPVFLSLPAVRNNCISYLKQIRGFNCFKVFQSQPRVNKRKRSKGCMCQSVQLKALSKEERGAAGGWGV